MGTLRHRADHLEHIAELAAILAAGLQRVRARKSSAKSAEDADKAVDCEGVWSGHAAGRQTENGT